MKEWIVKWVMENLDKLITDDLINGLKTQLVDWLRQQAAKTETEIDDAVVGIVARTLGVE